MGKLKEKLLNNLTEDELDDMFGVSSFDYVEYMERYKQPVLFDDNGDLIPDEVLEQMQNERETDELEYYELNDSIQTKYSDSDVMAALDSAGLPQNVKELIQHKLNGIWADKNGFE